MEKFEVKTTFAWLYQPISFLHGLSYQTQIYIVLFSLAICLIVYPLIRYMIAKIQTTLEPLRFELQHVMIVGGSDGLGKELVRELF